MSLKAVLTCDGDHCAKELKLNECHPSDLEFEVFQQNVFKEIANAYYCMECVKSWSEEVFDLEEA